MVGRYPLSTRSAQHRVGPRAALGVLAALGLCMLAAGGPAGAQPPAAPSVTVAAGDGALTVQWTAPSGATGVTSYDLRYIETSADESDANNWTEVVGAWDAGPLHYVLSGLDNGTGYDVQMRAVATANGAWSSTSAGTPADHGASRGAATTITLGVPAGGSVASDRDVDYFKFTVSGTKRIIAYTEGDAFATVSLQNSGRVLKFGNSSSRASYLAGPGHEMVWDALSAGTYYLEVHGLSTGDYVLRTVDVGHANTTTANAADVEVGSATHGMIVAPAIAYTFEAFYYRLVLTEATDLAIHTSGWIPDPTGTIYNASGDMTHYNDDGFVAGRQFLILARLEAGTHYIAVEPHTAAANVGPYLLHVEEVVGGGSSTSTAAPLAFGDFAVGTFDTASDIDYFRLELDEGTLVEAVGRSGHAELRTTLLDSRGDSVGPQSYSLGSGPFTASDQRTLAAGTFYLKVEPVGWTGGTGEPDTVLYTVQATKSAEYHRLVRLCAREVSGVSDPLYGCQWHLDNVGDHGGTAGEDMNIGDVWQTTTGAGVNVAVVDSGVDNFHEDLHGRFDAAASHHYAGSGAYFGGLHGTRVAGLIAAEHNSAGVRGVAPGTRIRSFDLLRDPTVSNVADAMSRERATTAVSNNSWGPTDSGWPHRAPVVWERAIEAGLAEGHGGLGTAYVFAAGNGGPGDDSGLDEYATHYGVTAVCAVDDTGNSPTYSEPGSNLWVCAPSISDREAAAVGIATTDLLGGYTGDFGGTSAAAPQVSGVAALVRSANTALTWRDVKLVLAGSARKNDSRDSGWTTGAPKYGSTSTTDRYQFNHYYGFGVVDAEAALALAQGWTNVPEMLTQAVSYTGRPLSVPERGTVTSSVSVGPGVKFVEHVAVDVVMSARPLRHLLIQLVSPSGAVSDLMRPNRSSEAYLSADEGSFRFGSARHLGEDAEGEWRLRITDAVTGAHTVSLDAWTLTVYGHRTVPGPPRIASVVAGADSLAVTWEAPEAAGASVVTGYDVRHIDADAADRSDGAWTVADDVWSSGALTHTITSLAAGVRNFDAQVRAVNASGDGAWSAAAPVSLNSATNAPRFGPSETGVRAVAENAPTGTAVGAPISATDADNDSLTYAVKGAGGGDFVVDASTGRLSTRRALNHETQARHEFMLTAVDPSGLRDEIDVTVNVTDIDEAPVVRGTAAGRNIENLGTFVGLYSAEDPEGAAVTWSLSGPDASHFMLVEGDRNSWLGSIIGIGFIRVWFAAAPDYEAWADSNRDNVFEFTVEASDGGAVGYLDAQATLFDRDEAPEISGEDSMSFPEGGSGEVASFGALDPEGAPVAWRPLQGPDRSVFSLVGGILRFRAPPDFENARDAGADNVYNVTLVASAQTLTSTKEVVVTVTDVDEAASVLVSPPQGSVGEELTASLTDPDGSVSGLVWRWERSSDGNSWSSISGANTSTYTPLPGDLGRRLRVGASYRDGEGAGKRAGAGAGVVLAAPPVNYDPRFALAEVEREVAENTAARAAFGAPVSAADAENNSLVYSLGGPDAASFAIDASTGQLRAAAALDYEQTTSYSLEVSVHDGRAADGSSDSTVDATATVAVTVTDVDEAPTLDELDPDDFAENGESVVARFTGSDPEGRDLVFTVTGADAGVFWMAPSGSLRFVRPPDYDDPGDRNDDNVYAITVQVTDGPNTASRAASVTVTDVDEAPTAPAGASVSFAENGTGTAATLEGADPENGPMTWTLSGPDSDAMSISATRLGSGVSRAQISFDAPPDFEAAAAAGGGTEYSVTATVSDGTHDVPVSVTVAVTDVDEPPTVSGDVDVPYDEDRTGAVGTYTGSDPEGLTVSWSLSGADAGAFDITDAGELSFKESHVVDFEDPRDQNRRNDYSVMVGASDGTQTVRFGVVVTVGNVDEDGMIVLSSQQPQERASLTAAVSDPDGSVSGVRWTWEKSPDGSSGWTAATASSSSSYTPASGDVGDYLRVSASYRDGHGTGKTASAQPSAAVRAAPPMNRAPQFPPTETGRRSVDENQPTGTAVGSPVAAVDLDAGDTVTYSLRGTQAAGFRIDANSGQISTGGPLDREEKSSYSFTVRATDASRAFDDASVRVTVSDVDEDPQIEGPTRVNYAENRTDAVAEYDASDPEGNPIMWSLAGAGRAHFRIDGGSLAFRSPPDFEQPAGGGNAYSVTVVASDGDRTATREVAVVVTGVDEPPDIVGSRRVSHPENTAAVGLYAASDPEDETVVWTLGGSDGDSFDLDADGNLSFKLAPDFEQRGDADRNNVYAVTLTASDGARSAAAHVRVQVIDGDDLGSVVLSPQRPGVGAGVTATLSDPDGGITDRVWVWERSADGQDWAEIADADSSRYVAVDTDLGQYLRVTVTYTDDLGPDKTARASTAAPVAETTVPSPGGGSVGSVGSVGGGGGGDGGGFGGGGGGVGGEGGPGPGPGGAGGGPAGPVQGRFTDVSASSVHAADIEALLAAGITTGCGTEPLRFCPDRPVTRGQMATFLVRALDLAGAEVPRAGFDDVDASSVHAADIEVLLAAGITSGCGTEPLRFCPGRPVTRGQMATFLVRALDLAGAEVPRAGFDDVDASSVHAADIEVLLAAGITTGCGTEPLRFCPDRPVTRAQMATFIVRLLAYRAPT